MHSGIVFAIAVAILLTLPIALVSLVLFNPANDTNVKTNLAKHEREAKDVPGGEAATLLPKKGEPSLNLEKSIVISKNTVESGLSVSLRGNEKMGTGAEQPLRTNKLNAKFHKELAHLWSAKPKNAMDLHFIHIPKCGGTSMTTILRQVACEVDSDRNEDCCTNPGFCDFHAHRRCASIKGCINHFPQREWVFKAPPSITIMREPTARLLSAWFYRGHSPNLDFFQVRPWFKDIKDGKRPRVTFDEYLDMPEYNNIQTRMLGANSFPYKNVTITRELYDKASDAIENMFFVGLQEVYDLSVKIMLRELNFKGELEVVKERDQAMNKKVKREKEAIRNNATAVAKMHAVNTWDKELYLVAVQKFCASARKYPDLYHLVLASGKVQCKVKQF
jgi:hypothetical protein